MTPLAVALINALYFTHRQSKQERSDRRFLVQAGTLLASTEDCETVLGRVARLTVPDLADWCVVDLTGDDGRFHRIGNAHIDPAKEKLLRQLTGGYSLAADRGYQGDGGNPIWNCLEKSCSPVLFPNCRNKAVVPDNAPGAPTQVEITELIRTLGAKSGIGVLIQARGRILGAFTLVYGSSGRTYGQRELEVAEDLAQRAALAIDNAFLYREAQKAARLREEFLSTVSHELRTPLNTILCWARLLRTRDFDESTIAHALEIIERNATAQAQIISDILDVSRMITGKLNLNVTRMNPACAVEAALNAVRPAAVAKSICMDCSMDPSIGLISGDPDRFQQVAWNLLSNAIKFTPRGGRVSVSLMRSDSSTRLTVTDNGQGICADLLPHIFEHFSQGDRSTARSYGGLGLGLAIVRHLVELHGGNVSVESPGEGKGARFTVDLPIGNTEGSQGLLTVPARTVTTSENAAPWLHGSDQTADP